VQKSFSKHSLLVDNCISADISNSKYNPKINLGEFPPDFELPRLVIETDATGKSQGVISETDTVKLSSFRGKKPVCMIMSSYT